MAQATTRSLRERGGRVRPPLHPSTAGEILCFEDAAVVDLMACDRVGNRADADFVVVGDAAAGPGCLVKIPQERQRSAANSDVIFDHFGQRTIREGTVADIVVLFESFDGRAIAAADTQGAIGKDAFAVADVSEDLLD